jgi:DNA-binding transcriptional ArsR family regulator
MKLDDAAARLEALGNPTRLKITAPWCGLAKKAPVGRLQDQLDVAASTLSHHLKTLIGVGLVTQARGHHPHLPHQLRPDARPDRLHGRGMLRRRHLLPGSACQAAEDRRVNFFKPVFR